MQKDHGREGGGGKMQNKRGRERILGHSTITELPTPKWPRSMQSGFNQPRILSSKKGAKLMNWKASLSGQ